MTPSGPPYIAIRSSKHSSLTANSHVVDFKKLMCLESFKHLMKTDDDKLKPIVILNIDRGPDENPCYFKVIHFGFKHFIEFDLDAIFIMTNAPGHSTYNRLQ